MKRLAAFLVLLFAGCLSTASHLTVEESRQVASLAKRAALQSGILTPDEQRVVDSTAPALTYYFLARPVADYSARWKLSADEDLIVSGRGDILRLENATIKRKKA